MVDTGSQLITALEVLPSNAPDNLGALEPVEASEANTGVPAAEAMGDAAYGDGDTRQAFADAGRTLIARVQGRPNRNHFPKEDFHIDQEAGACTFPAGNVTRRIRPSGTRTGPDGRTHRLKGFRFDGAVCRVCLLRSQCVAGSSGLGRTVQLHPQEALLQQARTLRQSEAFGGCRVPAATGGSGAPIDVVGPTGDPPVPLLRACQDPVPVVSGRHGGQPDIGGCQGWSAGRHGGDASVGSAVVAGIANPAAWLGQITTLTLLASASLTKSLLPIRGFRPDF